MLGAWACTGMFLNECNHFPNTRPNIVVAGMRVDWAAMGMGALAYRFSG